VQDLSLHILDIAENSITAGASLIEITVCEDTSHDILTFRISDNGTGMDPGLVQKATDPFFTTKEMKKVGLGIPLLAQAAKETGGDISVESQKDAGTTITAIFKLNHPDMKPLGDIEKTVYLLRATHPEIRIVFRHEKIT